MFDVHLTASNIAHDWPAIVGQLPKSLDAAIDALDATHVIEEPYAGFDPAKVTAENAAETVTKLAVDLVAASEFGEARSRVAAALAGRILRTAGAVVPEVIESLRPQFDAAVAEFSEAVSTLPEEISDEILVAAGPAVLSEYHRALEAQAVIGRIDGFLSSLHELPAYGGHQREQTLRVLNPVTREQWQALVSAATGGASGPLDPLYVTAVREGIDFEMHTPAEAAAIRADIEAQPFEPKRMQLLDLRAG